MNLKLGTESVTNVIFHYYSLFFIIFHLLIGLIGIRRATKKKHEIVSRKMKIRGLVSEEVFENNEYHSAEQSLRARLATNEHVLHSAVPKVRILFDL